MPNELMRLKKRKNASWIDRHGMHPKIIIDYIREHCLYGLVAMGLTVFGVIKFYQWSSTQGVTL